MKKVATLIAVGGLLVAPSGFAASAPVTQGYGGSGGEVQEVLGAKASTQATPKPVAAVATSSTLPFTGVDLALVSVAGITLLGMGFGLRKIAQRDEL